MKVLVAFDVDGLFDEYGSVFVAKNLVRNFERDEKALCAKRFGESHWLFFERQVWCCC